MGRVDQGGVKLKKLKGASYPLVYYNLKKKGFSVEMIVEFSGSHGALKYMLNYIDLLSIS